MFTVKITDKELAGITDANDDICFSKVMEFCLPRFDTNNGGVNNDAGCVLNIWEWQAAQTESYIMYISDHHGINPKYYSPRDHLNRVYILPYHVCRLYVIKIANMFCGNKSIGPMYLTTEFFDALGLCVCVEL